MRIIRRVKEVVRGQGVITIEFKQASMKLVGASHSGGIDYRSDSESLVFGVITGGYVHVVQVFLRLHTDLASTIRLQRVQAIHAESVSEFGLTVGVEVPI